MRIKAWNGSSLRSWAVDVTDVLNMMPEYPAPFSHLVMGGALLAGMLPPDERLNLQIVSDGVLGGALVDADASGMVRASMRPGEGKILDGRGPWGQGTLSVLRTKPYQAVPYRGSVALETGFFTQDLIHYIVQSEQIPSALVLGAKVGCLVQVIPGAEDFLVEDRLGDVLKQETPLGMLTALGCTQVLEEVPLYFACTCSQEKADALVAQFGSDDGPVTCEFCGTSYLKTHS